MPDITFIIPTKDRPEILKASLDTLLLAIGEDQCEILVINDSKSSRPLVEHALVRVIDNPGRGVASARNYGASIATGTTYWFLDDDIWITKEVYKRGKELIQQHPDHIYNFDWVYPPALESTVRTRPFGRYLSAIGFTTMKGWCKGMPWEDNSLFPTQWLAGATLLIPASHYNKVKGYDASFPLAGFEDYDFSVRVQNAGLKAFIDTTVSAFHNEVSKTSLRGFLQRTFNNSITRRHAVQIGYHDQVLKFSKSKQLLYKVIQPFENILVKLADQPKLPGILDPFLSLVYRLLIGAAIYRGYTLAISDK